MNGGFMGNALAQYTTRSSWQRQRGMSFIGVCLLLVVLIFAGYVVVKSVPIVSEYLSVKRVLKQAATGTTVEEVRSIFTRQSNIDYLDEYDNPLQAQDLIVRKVNDVVVVELQYEREIPLFGPAFLVYKFDASSQ